ncbi:ATP-dependent RNA helicase dhx37 [Cichlidogyrus casuarinus]|uniref:ATP-dependent RNA helicase dhx37 n=1 Tax=Cichlidogyrus casuarinus TaxID=1844966 RepID=A0ABD2QN57_9PLAT
MYRGEPVPNYKITPSGQWMSNMPVSVRLARMLLYANQCELMPYTIVLVAALTVPNLWVLNKSQEEDQTTASLQEIFVRQFVRDKHDLLLGDFAIILGTLCCLERFYAQLHGLIAIEDAEVARITNLDKGSFCKNVRQILNPDDVMAQLCVNCGVRFKAYREFRQLRRQLTEVLNANIPDLELDFAQSVLSKPTEEQVDKLRQLVLVASPCHLAQKIFLKGLRLPQKDRKRLRYAYKAVDVTQPVFIHHQSPINRENFTIVAFMEMHTTSKPFLTNVCAVDPQWIPFLAPECIDVRGVMYTPEDEDSGALKRGKRVAGKKDVMKRGKKAKHGSESETESEEEQEEEATEVKEVEESALTEPSYDAEHDQILVSAKEINYIGAGHRHLVKEAEESLDQLESAHIFPLPGSLRCELFVNSLYFISQVPLVSPASFKSMGEDECYTWAARWFARALLQGEVFREPHPLSRFFPKKIKTSLSTKTLTASWGL